MAVRLIPEHPEQYEPQWLDSLPLQGIVQMQESETRFINGIIRATKPQRMLEIGVFNGGSSMLMLNAVKNNSDAHLYSVDYAETVPYGMNKGKKIGWAVPLYTPELTAQWSLFLGGHVAEFIDKISRGGGLDLCFFDAAHILPGEILDFLIVLPYMKQSGIIIQHDVVLDHRHYKDTGVSPAFSLTCIAQPVLFAVMRSEKFMPLEFNREIYPTAGIAAHRLNDDTWRSIDDVFWALNLKWRYLPSDKDMEHIVKVLEKHYARKNVDMFLRNYELNKKLGVDWTPFAPIQPSAPAAAPVQTPTPVAAQTQTPAPEVERLTGRIARLEKRTYAALAGIMGFLAALAITAFILALRL